MDILFCLCVCVCMLFIFDTCNFYASTLPAYSTRVKYCNQLSIDVHTHHITFLYMINHDGNYSDFYPHYIPKKRVYLRTYTGTPQPRRLHLLVLSQIHQSCILQDTLLFLLPALNCIMYVKTLIMLPPHVNLKWKIIKHKDRNDKHELEILPTSCMPYL